MKNTAITLAVLTIILGWRIAPLNIVFQGIEMPTTAILSILSIALLGIAVLFRKPL